MMDSDDEREEYATWRGVPGSIILINVFDPSDKKFAAVAHAATCRMVRQHLRASSSHNVGVCLYGAEDTSNSSAFGTKSVVDIIPLSTPTLDDFKKLRNLDVSTYKQVKELELSDVLWHSSKMFANCKKQFSSRTVILLTRLENPPIQSDQKPTLKRVVDLVDSNIDIRIINIAEDDYKVDSFYNNFLIEANKGKYDFILPKPIWDPKEIEQMMHQQSHRHLAVARLSFEIGNGLSIGVGVYNLLIRSGQYQPKKVNLDRESNAIVSSVTKTLKVSAETPTPGFSAMDVDEDIEPKQMPVLKSELLHYLEYGGERVEFTDTEKKSLQNPFGPPMMKLLGFKPAGIMCKEKWFLKTGYFLFPNENIIEGSTTAFKALHQACVETSMVAICVLCTRVNAKPNIVGLSPCTHPLGLDIEIGFDVIHIPFVENVRNLPAVDDEESTNISEEQKILMKDIMKMLQFQFKPDMFENPKLQSEYGAVEAIALEEEDLDPFVDTTKPDASKFQTIPEDMFEELFGPFGPVAPKRTAARDPSASKRAKVGEGFDESIFYDRIKYQTVHQYTVPQLKEILKRKHDSDMPPLTGLKKDQLVELVYQYYK